MTIHTGLSYQHPELINFKEWPGAQCLDFETLDVRYEHDKGTRSLPAMRQLALRHIQLLTASAISGRGHIPQSL